MKQKTITFTSAQKVEILESDIRRVAENEVLVENEISAISAGTERASLLDLPNLGDVPPGSFPKVTGYSGVGRVVEIGKQVKSVQVGNRVLRQSCTDTEQTVKAEPNCRIRT